MYGIEVKSFPYPYPYHLFIMFLKLFPKLFLVAECCGQVVGYVVGIIERGNEGHVVSLAVDPKYRGLGIGKSLMIELERRFREFNVSVVKLEVSVRNGVAINLYKSLGYVIAGRAPNYYPDGSDAYLMLKVLRSNDDTSLRTGSSA